MRVPAPGRHSDIVAESRFERVLGNASRLAIVGMGAMAALVLMHLGQVILAPVALAVVIGLMFGPVADYLESRGIAPALSAGMVVILLVAVIASGIMLLAIPLSEWVGRAPRLWSRLQAEIANFREPLQALANIQDQLKSLMGGDEAMEVSVEEGNPLADLAFTIPAIGAEIAIFLASLYFFVATREHIRISILSLCVTRRMRWRTAHIFRDVEKKVSRFLLSVTVLNFGVGVAVALSMWVIGVPSPLLWGGLAMLLNFIPYVGQAVMVVVLVAVGLGTQTGLTNILLPVGSYAVITFIEGQFLTPHVLGRTMTLNPFLIFLSISFWLWAWGPIGGLIAVPLLLIMHSVLSHVLPGQPVRPRKPVRVRPDMTEKEIVLANAAAAIREKNEEEEQEQKGEGPPARHARRLLPPEGTAPDGLEVH